MPKLMRIVPALLLLLALLPVAASLAQPETMILTFTVPSWAEDPFEAPDYFSDFEAGHPGVKVVLAPSNDNVFFANPASDIEAHLDGASEYATSADVLYVNESNLSVEATRAGYFLDLAPLTAGDSNFSPNDFFPSAYSAFQWNRGLWAMPIAMSVQLVIYDPAALDQQGLSYPDERWTLDNFADVDRAFAEFDANGEVTAPGLAFFGSETMLLRALLGHGFYDDSTLPEQPRFSDADTEALLTTLLDYQAEGLLSGTPGGSINFAELPLVITQPFQLSEFQPEDQQRAGALLPGGTAGLSVTGFAISSGTQHPELAYELVKWLSSDLRTINGFFSNSPARQSLIGAELDDPDAFTFLVTYSEENQALIDTALANGMSPAELRYSSYLQQALNRINEQGVAPQVALQEAEAQALENLQIAAERRATTSVIIATPIPTPQLTADQVNLNFGLTSFINPLPNRERWDEVIAEFTATDPQVGQISMDTEFAPSLTAMAEQFDCFYLPYNSAEADDIVSVLSLDPFLDADFAFDRNDLMGNVLAQVQRDNRTWAYPLNLQPQVLWYNANIFSEAGVPAPDSGWTTDAFVDALQTIKIDPADPAPFQPQEFGGNYILMLTAAFGGLPLDYTVDPVGINFTDPANVAALQQVLDLARGGYIDYSQLANLTGGGFGGGGNNNIPIFSETLNQFSFQRLSSNNDGQNDPYRLTGFPQGTQYTPVTYTIGTVYISASTANPEACYRWINTVAQHPELFTSMPARYSQLSNPEITASLGVDMSTFYTEFANLLQAPNVVEFPSPFGGGNSAVGNFIVQFWLNRAMDRYVLEDGDLETELADAELFARDYQTCIADIPPYNPNDFSSQIEQLTYIRQFFECATNIDPSMASILPNLPG